MRSCPLALLAGFARSHLDALRRCLTTLISEPNLNRSTANLLSSLTDGKFLVVAGSNLACYAKSTAIYAGENPEAHAIQNSIHIHLTPANAGPSPHSPQLLKEMIERIPVHLKQNREKNLPKLEQSTWAPSGLSSEMAILAAELGRCVVDAPELRQKLVGLLKTQDSRRLSDLSNSTEAVVLEASLNLCHQEKTKLLAGKIASEVNRIQKARGERLTYNAEKVGHVLKKVGLYTRRLGKAGRGLVMDLATMKRVHKVAALYSCVGLDPEDNNLHCQLCIESKRLM
jgi:hypothetical protein